MDVAALRLGGTRQLARPRGLLSKTRAGSPTARAALGLIVAAVAPVAELAVWPLIARAPMLLFYPAVLLAAEAGGFAAGASATIGSTLALSYFFLAAFESFSVTKPIAALDVAIFTCMALIVAWFMSRSQEARRRACAERDRAEEAARAARDSALISATATARAEHAAAVKDEVLAVVAHDLKNPLQTITVSASLLKRDIGDPATLDMHAARISRAAERATRLVRNLLDAASMDARTFQIEPQRWGVRPLIDEALAAFAPLAALRDVRVVAASVPDAFVFCDMDRLEQALHNVIGNAVQYTPPRGEVRLGVEATESAVTFTVRDTGPGMTPEQVAHAFDRFWRSRHGPGGSGLGLYIARGVVEAHGGRIKIDSEPGRGTTVTMVVPQPGGVLARLPEAGAPALH